MGQYQTVLNTRFRDSDSGAGSQDAVNGISDMSRARPPKNLPPTLRILKPLSPNPEIALGLGV